jgi:hypothetical protein
LALMRDASFVRNVDAGVCVRKCERGIAGKW